MLNDAPLLDALGRAFARRLLENGLFDPLGTPAAPTSGGQQGGIVRRHNTVGRWVRRPEFAMPEGYVDEVLRELDRTDRQG